MLSIQDNIKKLIIDLFTLKVVSESRVTWATSVPILVFLGLLVVELGPMYATDRLQTKSSLNASTLWGRGIIKLGLSHNQSRNCSAPETPTSDSCCGGLSLLAAYLRIGGVSFPLDSLTLPSDL